MVRYKNEPIVKSSEPMNQQQLVCVGNDGYEGKVWQKFVLIKLCSSLKIIGVSAVLLVAVSALTFILFEGLNSSIHYTIIVRSDENKTLLNVTHKESRFKRSIIPRLKRVTRNTLKQLEPNGCCNEHCSFIKTQVANLQGETIKIYSELQKLNQYLENLKINCLNKTNNQLNVDMVNFKKDTTGGLFDNSVSENEDNYEAAASDNDYSAHIPPTGPDGGYLTGAGESLKTSQQMVVNMPQRLEKICYPVGGTTKNIVCSDMPVQQNPYFLTRQSQPGNYFVRLLGKNSPNNVDEGSMHVPTAISSPNPYFLPTLEGYPIVSPVSSPYSLSGASPQMYAAFNPYSGYTSIQSPNQPIIVSPMGYQSTGYQPAPNLQPMFSVPRQPQMFCTYIAVPGSQYRFPPVSGVSESGQKNELDLRAKEASRQSIEENFKFNKTTVGSKSAEDFYVLCKDGQLQISRSQWCDNRVDCIDKSDEMFCSCKSRMGSLKACDRYPDCPNGEDEEECFGCSKDMLNCDDDIETGEQPTCIPYTKRCDNVMDCRNGKDEIDCSLIAKDIGSVNDKFPISYSEGYVHRNYNGKWYPVCHSSASEHWAKSACIAEFGPSNHDLQTQIANSFDYQGLFVISDPYGGISLSSRCGTGDNHITWVKCPQIDCGTRSPQAIPYEDNFNRYKRYLSEHGFYEVSDAKSSYKKFCSYEQAKEAAPANEPPAVFPFPQTNPNEQDTYERYWGPLLNPYLGYDISNTGNTGNTGRASPSYSNLRYVRETPQNRNPRGSERRIVGGSKSMPGAWPWVVLIHKDGHIHCGGVILNEYFVLTAAHCMDNYVQHFFEVRAGILRRLSFSPQEQRRVIGSVEIHSNYNTKDFSNDIAVVKVDKPFNFNRWVLPILPPPDIDNAVLEKTCTVVGWGATEEHGKDPDQMHEVELPILSGCKHRADRQADDICAGYEEGGKDSCQGDSGGPLLCTMDGYDKWYVAGIVSHGNGCARKEEPGVYTRVRLYTDWIKRATRNLLNSQRPRPKSKCPGYTCDDGLCIRKLLKCNDIVDCLQPDDELCDDENSGEYVTQLKTNNETEQMEVESHSQSNVQVINIPSVVESISTPKTVKPGGDRNLDELTFVTEIKTSTAVNTEFGVNLKPTVGIDSLVKQKNSDENDISAKPPIVTTQEMVESTSPKFGIHEESSPLPKETSDCTDGSCLTKGNESEEQNLGPSTVPPFTTQSPTSQHFTNKDENSSEWKEATATETDLKSHMEKSMERTTMPTPTEIKITLPVRSGETLVANSTKVSEQDENISPSSLADKNMSSDSSAEIETSDNSTSTFIGQNTGGLSSGDLTKGNNSREEISDNEDSSTENVAALNKTQDNSSEENSSGEEHTTNGTFNNSLELNRSKEANKSTTYDSTETFDDSFKTNVSSKQESGDKQFSADVLKYNSSIHQGSENQSSNGLNNQNIGSTSLENGTSSNLTASNISRETTFEESNRTRVDGDVKNKDFASKVNVSDNSDLKTTEQPPIKNNSDEFDSSKDQIVYNINGAAVENITINPLVEATTKSSAKVQVGSNENLIGNVTDDSDLNVTEPTITKNNSDQYVSNKDQISYDISGQTVENITIIPLIEATTKSTVKEQVGSNENSKENVSENSDLKVTERTITKNNSDQFVSNKDQISHDISGQTVENITIISLVDSTTVSSVINSSEVDKIKNKEEFSSQQMNQSISMESNKSSHEHTSHSSNFTHMNSSSSSVGSESLSAQTVNFTQNSNITHQLETQSATQQNSSLESKIESQVSTSSNNSLAASEDQRLSNKTDSESSNFNAPTQNSTVSEFNSDTNIKRNTSSCIASISKTLVTTDTGEIKEEIVRKNCSNSETKNQLRFEEDDKFFQCRSLNQSVYRYKMCDGITDCFDLSDESNCTCRLKLERKLPHLICDTRKDCLDGTDEATCEAKCPEGQFSCSKSKSCISAEQRCDGTAQCKHNEDEENCYAIVDGDSVTLDHAGRPKLSNTGLVYYWKNNDWSPYCVTEEEMDLTKALKACNSYHYEDVGYVLKNFTLPPSEKNLGTNDGLHCLVPNVTCLSMYPDRQQPWKAYLYLNDNLYGIAVLIDSSWMITGALTDLDIQNNVMYAQMGSIDNSLDIIGPYTQYIQIDDVIHNENFTLLHLSHKPEFTHGVVPIGTLERPTSRDIVLSPKEPDCLAVGLSTEYLGEVVMDLQLLDDCWEGENCFKILKPLQNCEQTKSPVFGYISCYSYNYGTSLVSLFHQEDGFCRDSCKVNYQSISDYSTTIKEAIASYQGSQFNEPVCETIKCELGNCLAWDQLSNGVFDCDDGRDESEEAKGRKTTYCETHQNCSCKPAEFKCTSGECLHLSKYCNGSPDCIDGSDESEKCMSCDHFLSMTTPDRLCDSNINCENKEDENVGLCQSKYNCSSDMFFNCERSKVCIPNDFVCDFEKDCPQGEDEEECKGIDMELENEGIFSENLSGFWYSKCVTMKPTERSLNDLCQYVNNSTHKQYMMRHVNKEIIVKDVFSSLRINENVGFHIRMDRPYLRKDINGTCIVLYVVCN